MANNDLEQVLQELECLFLEYAVAGKRLHASDKMLRASSFIFSQVLLDKSFDLMLKEKISQKSAEAMAVAAGSDLREIVRKYTGIDTYNLF